MPRQYRCRFSDEFLILERGDGEGCYRVAPWPQPRSEVRLIADGDWIPCPPPIRLVTPLRPPRPVCRGSLNEPELSLADPRRPSRAEANYRALVTFRRRLPGKLARALEAFGHLQWEALMACALSERFQDLVLSNPVLASLWLARCRERGFCRQGAMEMLAIHAQHGGETSQRGLLRELELPPSRTALKLLRRCHLPCLDPPAAEHLAVILRDPVRLRRLRHVPRLGRGLLEVAVSRRLLNACTPALLAELAGAREELHRAPTAGVLRAYLALLDELGMPLPRRFVTRDALREGHRKLSERLPALRRELEENVAPAPAIQPPAPRRRPPPRPPARTPRLPGSGRKKTRKKQEHPLPAPPFPGNRDILPLTTRSALLAEGRAQRNCVNTYARYVESGRLYIYRVLAPERCTLSIVKRRNGRWACSELKRARNGNPRPETVQAVEDWLRTSQAAPVEDASGRTLFGE